jgi:uncharacterized protein with FMN-binding domain
MKKISSIILSTFLIFSLSSCGTKTNPPSNTGTNNPTPSTTGNNITSGGNTSSNGKTITYKDGVYDVKHKSTKPGFEEAVVTIKSGKIQSIELKRLDDNQKEVNYNDWDGTKNGYPNLKQDRMDLANAMLSKQSSDVNVISGATQSSNGWKAAVASALSKAQ